MATLITGASKGIGAELARVFAENGHDLVLCARSKEALDNLAYELRNRFKINVEVIIKDLTEIKEVKELYQQAKDMDINILVNNAGFGDMGRFHETSVDKQIDMVNLNISALTYLAHQFAKDFIARGEETKILNVGSIAAYVPGPLMATYYATKAYVQSLSNALSVEYEDTNLQVSVLCPGATHSDFGRVAGVSNATAFKIAMQSIDVAKIAYKDFMAGKKIIVTGMQNKFLVSLMKFMPRFAGAKVNEQILAN